MKLTQIHQADALSTARLRLISKSRDVTTSLTSPGDIKYLQNQHSFLWLAKSTWIPKEETDSCESFKMFYGARKHGDKEEDSAGGLIFHLFLPFPVTPVSREGTFFPLILLCQTPGRTGKGWPAVMVEGPGHSVGVWPAVSPGCFGVTPEGWRCKLRLAGRAVHTVLYLLIKQGPEHWQRYEEEENTSHHFNLPNQLFLKGNRQKGKVKPTGDSSHKA